MTTQLPAPENQAFDRKSLRVVVGSTAKWSDLASDCVSFANANGGEILIGIEDRATQPPADQRIDPALVERIRKRVGELSVNVQVYPEIRRATNGGEFIAVSVQRATAVASTSDGRYYLRVGDACLPLVGADVLRLASDRPAVPWEALTALAVPRDQVDGSKVAGWAGLIRSSGRVKPSVKEKGDAELLDHYGLAVGPVLTNLGVLLVGRAADRARLGSAPIVQAITYDERGQKVAKQAWDDHALSPLELVEAVWDGTPVFREAYEVPDGLFRVTVPAFDKVVVRELLVNALVHRPYTQQGDIFLNINPDRLEVVNAGRLPLGVTPRNILHESRRRNEGLARVFHDCGLMEREGSGFDLMYDRLLASGRSVPEAAEGIDSVRVTIGRRVLHSGAAKLMAAADERHQLTQRERITLGLVGQTEGLTAAELAARLELGQAALLGPWLGRLVDFGLLVQAGRTRATRYFVPPELVRAVGLDQRTTLTRLEPHRLRALILEDIERYPDSAASDIVRRIGSEIADRSFRRALAELVAEGLVVPTGERRWRRYRAAGAIGQTAATANRRQ